MVLSGKFCVQLGCFLVAFPKPSPPNKIVLSQLVHSLNRFRIKELAARNNINVFLVFKRDFLLGIQLLLKVFIVRIGTSELVCVDVGFFNYWQVIGERSRAVLIHAQPLSVHVCQDQRGTLMSKHRTEEQIMLDWNESLVPQVIQKLRIL